MKKLLFLMVALALLVSLVIPVAAPAMADTTSSATIQTDKTKYSLGETMIISGSGFMPGGTVNITVQLPGNNGIDSLSAPADTAGSFLTVYNPPPIPGRYKISATDGTNTALTAATEADVSIGLYDQCSNNTGTGYTSGDAGCRWINGSIGPSNSYYPEGDGTIQRVWLTGYTPSSSHTVTFEYGTTKAGKHAYDFLTRWDWSENWVTDADRCQDIDKNGVNCELASETQSVTIPHDPNIPTNWESNQGPGARTFTIRGGTITSLTTPALVSGNYGIDSETGITVSFSVASSGYMCPTSGPDAGTCGVVIWFGAHVAKSLNWIVENGTTGAGTISGNPYHVALAAIDGDASGRRDNQMKATEAFGTITIVKDAIPNSAQNFQFNLNHETTNAGFLLDDDADPTLPNSKTFLSIPTGLYTASELNIPSGWELTGISCVVTGGGESTTTPDVGNAEVDIQL